MTESTPAETTAQRGSNALLRLVCLAQFMVILDVSGVRRRFFERFSVEEQRVMGGYFDRILDWIKEEEA